MLEAEGRRDDLQRQLTELEARVVALTEQKEAAETALSRAAQPTSYLVNKLREEEASRIQQSAMCDRLSAEVRALQKERAAGAEVGIHLGHVMLYELVMCVCVCLGKYPAAGAPDLTATAEKRAAGHESTGE